MNTTATKQKRDSGDGSCYFLASRQRWMVGYTDADGRRKTKVAVPNTEVGAEKTLRKLIAQRDAGETQGRSATLAAFSEQWLQARAVSGCRPRTIQAYRERLSLYVLPTLGALRLDKITSSQIERLYAAKLAGGLSPQTVALVHHMLHALLRAAKKRRLLAAPPTELVDPPRVTKYVARTLTIAEARQLLEAVATHRYGPMWTFMLGTGCRYGEATGLLWHNVDMDNATALICQQATRNDGRYIIAPVKTDAGRRTVQLPSFVVAALRTQQTVLARLRTNTMWSPLPEHEDLVFPSGVGALLTQTPVRLEWHAVLTRIGLEGRPGQARLRMHDLRHTKGTLMADSGEDTTVIQRTLGHSRQSITADLYIGQTNTAQRSAANRYDELLRQHAEEDDTDGS
jgi:integrase